jgi:HEAT repeat protein
MTTSGADGPVTVELGWIEAKLDEARSRGLECFGSRSHQFVLNPPLAEAAVARFEAEHGVPLPAGYRAFVTRLGDGGAGPYYGLLPLEQGAAAGGGILSRPSPLSPAMPGSTEENLITERWPEQLTDGAITLVEQGCAHSSMLIVTGAHRGTVVNLDPDLSAPPYFTRDTGFLAWYKRWLDELLWGWDDSWFGFGLPGREPDLAAALLTRPYTDRRDALRTLARIPALSQDTVAAVAACLDDPDAAVRAAAISLLGRHGGTARTGLITGRLHDPDPAVRSAALTALPGDQDSTRCHRAALTDPDPVVVRTALRLLADQEQLTENDVRPLLAAGNPAARATATSYLRKTAASAVPAVLFSDPDPSVVRQAILAAGEIADRQAVPHLLQLLAASGDPDLRTMIVRILGRLADPAALDVLIAETAATDAFTRLEAARALGQLADPRAEPALKGLLTDTTKPRRYDHTGMLRSMSNQSVTQVAADALRKLQHSTCPGGKET